MPLTIPFSFGSAGLNTPTTQLDSNYAAIANWINPRNPASGNLSARPAAGNAGALFIAVDQNNQLYLDSGTAWLAVSAIQAPSPYATLAGQATPPATPVSPNLIVYVGTGPGADLTILDEQGVSRTIQSALFRVFGSPLSTVTNTTVGVSIFPVKPVIKAHTLTPNRALRISWWHSVLNNTGATRTYYNAATLGGQPIGSFNTTGAGITWGSVAAQTLVHTEYLVQLYAPGALQYFMKQYWAIIANQQSATVGQTAMAWGTGVAVNDAIDNTLDITVAYDAANVNATDTTTMVLGELL
jgi:hypothetical protein